MNWLVFGLFLLIITLAVSLNDDSDYFIDYEESSGLISKKWDSPDETGTLKADVCVPQPLGGIDWILNIRQSDHGWKEETHRAVIALAVNNWKHLTPQEVRQIENHTSILHPNDLALYIHALISTRRNPRNFYGIDLVDRLTHIVSGSYYHVHPFLLLALCNANSLPKHQMTFTQWMQQNRRTGKDSLEYNALALNAFECLKSLDFKVDDGFISEVQKNLAAHQQVDGSFGNVYTTALVVQALSGAPSSLDWNKQKALEYLRSKSTVDVNMISTYLIQLALNADRVRFIKDLYPDLTLDPVTGKQDKGYYFVQYTIRIGKQPDVYFTISIKVPPSSNFFYIMNQSAHHDAKFNFSSYTNRDGKPSIFAISGVPNDAEENLYWRLCLQTEVDHNRHQSKLLTFHGSPVQLVPRHDDHVIFWYRDSDCEET
ncbi:uncharacterized protein TNIN_188361 [Trichonephila inaurata madagascariensis]|uniref:Uncharacterized protein n=1 Tax=Trichonephila inaurata madagascariensis TaxID=2747483 RepID=A0A8X6XZW5_9ARAC|nr:uncharacterized protein TNIN_188361 [Trichonephila inaurata madagascariensis]